MVPWLVDEQTMVPWLVDEQGSASGHGPDDIGGSTVVNDLSEIMTHTILWDGTDYCPVLSLPRAKIAAQCLGTWHAAKIST